MRRIRNSLPAFLLLAVLPCDLLLAGNGKLSGRIFDTHTGSPIPGTVRVSETGYGSVADSTGAYFILEIPPGKYDIRCSAVGYTARVVTGLAITADNLRKLDFAL